MEDKTTFSTKKKKVHLKRKDYTTVSLFVLCAVIVMPSYNTVAWTPAVSP